ncbi:MAG TPA: glycosyltransferase family 1 protein [Roseiflexaceae bacterium]|nr:glycosyltransferase family 1 protein [Roseiflexaceae bacterium]
MGRYVYNLLRALGELEHPHRLLALHNPALPNRRFDMAALAALPSLELVETTARPFRPGEHLAIPRLLRRLGADCYHATYYVRPYVGLPCPAVTTLYDIIPRLFPGEASQNARLMFDSLTRLALRFSQRLIAISASARDDFAAAYRVPPGRIAVTPLAADPRFRPLPAAEQAAARARYGLPERYILTLSSNKPHKNLPALVEAYALLVAQESNSTLNTQHSKLLIAGHWDPRYPEARLAAERLGLGGRVLFLHGVADADLPALYSGAELFVYPSRYEGFGLPPLEALACGLPVVCGGASSLPEVVGDAALLVDPADPAALADGMRRALADEALRARLRAAAPLQAARFSWRRTAELTLRVYERVEF